MIPFGGPFGGTLNTRCLPIIGIQEGAIFFDNHPLVFGVQGIGLRVSGLSFCLPYFGDIAFRPHIVNSVCVCVYVCVFVRFSGGGEP